MTQLLSSPVSSIEPYQERWKDRTQLVRRTTVLAIKNYIRKHHAQKDTPIFYDWHPTEGFVAYLKRNANPSDLFGLEDYHDKWENRSRITCKVSELSIQKYIAKYQPMNVETIYYDWHPTDGFVAYMLIPR